MVEERQNKLGFWKTGINADNNSIIIINVDKGIIPASSWDYVVFAKLQTGFIIRMPRDYEKAYVSSRIKSQKLEYATGAYQ